MKTPNYSHAVSLIAPFIFVALIALAAWFAFSHFIYMPSRTVVMAMYSDGSLNAELAKRYREILARNDIDLKLAPSPGAVESVAQLRDPKSGVSVALIPGGITTQQESPGLVSLGTLFYQPLWVFSRREVLHRHTHLRGLHVSIGPEGSSSRAFSLELLDRAGVIDRKSAILLPYTPSESAERLIRGEIDAAIFLDGWESPAVQMLLNGRHIKLESTPRADAFVSVKYFVI